MMPLSQTSVTGTDKPLSLSDLAVAGYLFECMTGYDEPLKEFRASVGGRPDLGNKSHRLSLLKWLNLWGCRHLAKDYHCLASEGLEKWWESRRGCLPNVDRRLLDPGVGDLDRLGDVFDSLSAICAAKRNRTGREVLISFGPTAAAKTLFVLRPHFFVPWDDAMRLALGLDRSGESYGQFLKDARQKLTVAQTHCRRLGVDVDELPGMLGRQGSTAAELMNAYYWITLTRRVSLPDKTTLRRWFELSADR